jgi:hypothetical protein
MLPFKKMLLIGFEGIPYSRFIDKADINSVGVKPDCYSADQAVTVRY